jgi:hypothetical protein
VGRADTRSGGSGAALETIKKMGNFYRFSVFTVIVVATRKFGNATKFSSLQNVCCVSGPHSFDLDPDPCPGSGSLGFGPPESGYVIICTDRDLDLGSGSCSGSFHQQAKKLRKVLNSDIL